MKEGRQARPLLLLAAAGLWVAGTARGADAGLGITVRLDNRAHAPIGTVERAQTEVIRLFRDAGIEIRWINCTETAGEQFAPDCLEPGRPGHFGLTILSQPAASFPKTALGYAVPSRTGAGLATVFYRRIDELARTTACDKVGILGYAIAHEVGHLLLPGKTHSPTGVMHARWEPEDWQIAGMGFLCFSRQEATSMRDSAKRFLRESK